jgi:sec-independent protein translocase protein TatA
MFGLQPTHLLIIAVIALIFFGPSRLPDLARSLGKSMKEFQYAMKDGAQEATDQKKLASTNEKPAESQEPTDTKPS